MIGFAAKKKKKLFRKITLSVVLLGVITSSIVIAPKKALAVNDTIGTVFPCAASASEIGTNISPDLPTTGPAYKGLDNACERGYVVSNANLKIELDPEKLASGNTFTAGNNAFFWININMSNGSSAEHDYDHNGKIDTTADIGSWAAVYFTNPDGSPRFHSADDVNGKNGIFLEIGTGLASVDLGTPPIRPVLTDYDPDGPEGNSDGFHETFPLDNVIDFTKTEQRIPVAVGSLSHLKPGTHYFARIVLEARGGLFNSFYDAASNLVSFKTGSDVAANNYVQQIGLTNGETATGSTDNSGQLLGGVTCAPLKLQLAGCLVNVFYFLVWVPSSWMLHAAGWLLDASIVFSISTKIYNDPSFISSGWRIIRDVSNIFFLFMLIFAAFKMILGDAGAETKKIISSIILIAIVINFSLFFTKVIIDSSNILARVFYRQIQLSGTTDAPVTNVNATGLEEKSLSQALTDGFNIQNFTSIEAVDKLNEAKLGGDSYIFIILFISTIVNLTAAWTFFICSLLFVGRIAGLWVSMIFSALAFATIISPKIKIPKISWAAWLTGLLKMSFMAPIFLFFIYLIISFVDSQFLDGLFLNMDNFKFFQFIIAIIMQFMILIVLVKQARDFAKDFAGEVGGALVDGLKGAGQKVGAAVTGAALAVATEGTSLAARSTIGRAGAKVSESDSLKAAEAKGGLSGWFARQTLKAGEYLGTASFDPRGNKGFDKALGSLTDVIGYKPKAGKAKEGGYFGDKERTEKERKERFEKLKTKKSPEQLTFTDAGNRALRDKYKNDIDEFLKKRSAAYEKWAQPQRKNPGWNERQAQQNFVQRYNSDPNTKPPAPPQYKEVTADEFNKKLQKDYENTLRNKTVPAAVEKATGGLIKGGGREGELAAAQNLDKAQKGLADLKKSQEQLTKAIEKLDKQIEKADKKYQEYPPTDSLEEKQRKIREEMAAKQREVEFYRSQIKNTQKKYNELPQSDASRVEIGKKLDKMRLEQEQHDNELQELKDIFRTEELKEERTKKADLLDKTNEKIKKAGGSVAKKKEEPKKEE